MNGGRHGFFKSERGLRQGDHVSLSLFVIAAELLSKMLNDLSYRIGYKGFHMNSNGPQINHLSFADDSILFCNGSKRPLEMILRVLKTYEDVSGQLMNKDKSCFTVAANTNTITITRIKRITSMNHQQFPIKYLGCPLITGKIKISHYSGMFNKIINKIRG